ncbi:hypothetical protein MMC09_001077 [Bachmanniomyces sp. S44760]|nr:hypothetical protein [Bachmanniomyces sp. S44760]
MAEDGVKQAWIRTQIGLIIQQFKATGLAHIMMDGDDIDLEPAEPTYKALDDWYDKGYVQQGAMVHVALKEDEWVLRVSIMTWNFVGSHFVYCCTLLTIEERREKIRDYSDEDSRRSLHPRL